MQLITKAKSNNRGFISPFWLLEIVLFHRGFPLEWDNWFVHPHKDVHQLLGTAPRGMSAVGAPYTACHELVLQWELALSWGGLI